MGRLFSLLGLLGIGLGLLVAWTLVSALTACLNESPRFADVARSAMPGLSEAARSILGRFRLMNPSGSCEPSTLARLLGVVGLAYVGGLVLLDAGRLSRRVALGVVLGVALACQSVLFLTPGLLSTDILDYASYGRVAAVHGLNPYEVTPETFTSDAFWGYGAWQGVVTVYGPLWTSIDAAIARALPAGDPVQLVLAYKSLAFLTQLGNLALVWWLLGQWMPARGRIAAFAMFAWNPLVLLELVGNGHNETLMSLLLLFGLVALTLAARAGGRSTLPWVAALVCLELGALVKFVPIGVGAAVAFVWLRRLPNARARLRQGLLVSVLLLSIALLVSWPWLSSSDLLRPLLGVANGGQRFKDGWQDAPAAWIAVRILPPLGVPPEPVTLRESVSRTMVWGVTRAIFLVYLAFELRSLWRQSRLDAGQAVRAVVASSARALLLAVVLFVTQVYPWYFLWPLPLVTLLGWGSPLSKAVVAFSVTFLPAYYLREFQSYGVFYLPVYLAAALLLLVVSLGLARLLAGGQPISRSRLPASA